MSIPPMPNQGMTNQPVQPTPPASYNTPNLTNPYSGANGAVVNPLLVYPSPVTPSFTQPYMNGGSTVQPVQPPQNQVPSKPSYYPGKVVKSIDEIMPNEVSNDGAINLFPSSDFTCIYAKQMDGTGRIQDLKYVPEQTAVPTQEEGNVLKTDLSAIMDRLDQIETLVKQNSRYNGNHNRMNKKIQNGSRKPEIKE